MIYNFIHACLSQGPSLFLGRLLRQSCAEERCDLNPFLIL
uniref:Uncharacterized protein n=1 Tax=Lepeophtheirus salmonis TaxID=72036 RepID=A0A0K2VFD0_LEPSM